MPPRSRCSCMAPATASCSATCTATSRAGPRTCPATTARARSSTCSPACVTAPARAHRHRGQGHAGRRNRAVSWFEVPGRVERDLKVVCGHWSALGLTITQGVHAIDTGAVWGGKLTALQLDTDELRVVQVPGRDVPAPVPNARPPARPAHERPPLRHRAGTGRQRRCHPGQPWPTPPSPSWWRRAARVAAPTTVPPAA